jgi:hypothetical protein
MRSKSFTMKLYEWLIGAICLPLLHFTLQSFTKYLAAFESTVANIVVLFTGPPALILLAVSRQLVALR